MPAYLGGKQCPPPNRGLPLVAAQGTHRHVNLHARKLSATAAALSTKQSATAPATNLIASSSESFLNTTLLCVKAYLLL